MAEVGIKRRHQVVGSGVGKLEANFSGRSKSQLSLAMDRRQLRVLRNGLLAPVSCPIWRSVIDHQNFGMRKQAVELVHQPWQIVQFVICRHNDEQLGSRVHKVFRKLMYVGALKEKCLAGGEIYRFLSQISWDRETNILTSRILTSMMAAFLQANTKFDRE